MKKRLLLLIAPIIALILECLPYGVVLNFADGPDSTYTATYSYFDITPFGYASFGPLPAAVLTCVLLLLTVIYVFSAKQGVRTAAAVLSILAGLLSASPVMYGLNFLSVITVAVSLLLFAEAAILLMKPKAA